MKTPQQLADELVRKQLGGNVSFGRSIGTTAVFGTDKSGKPFFLGHKYKIYFNGIVSPTFTLPIIKQKVGVSIGNTSGITKVKFQ